MCTQYFQMNSVVKASVILSKGIAALRLQSGMGRTNKYADWPLKATFNPAHLI